MKFRVKKTSFLEHGMPVFQWIKPLLSEKPVRITLLGAYSLLDQPQLKDLVDRFLPVFPGGIAEPVALNKALFY